jgi:hypothetical protein
MSADGLRFSEAEEARHRAYQRYSVARQFLPDPPLSFEEHLIARLEASEADYRGCRRALAAAQPKVEWQAQNAELAAENEHLREELQKGRYAANRRLREALGKIATRIPPSEVENPLAAQQWEIAYRAVLGDQ